MAILPARGGSRRIPRKNIALFHGRPMISYPIQAAEESGLFDRIIVSTNDEDTYSLAFELGAQALYRMAEWARDEVGTQELMAYVLGTQVGAQSYDHACCVYPCTPMMTAQDLIRAEKWLAFSEGRGYAHIPGWFYYARVCTFLQGEPVENSLPMTASRERYIDINTPEDWAKAEAMYAALHPEIA